MNHDALFKMLLKTPSVLQGFFRAFLPEVARFIDFEALEFVDKERVTIDGRKRTGDLLIKTRFQGEAAGFLIHLEHQAQHESDLARRMLEYFILDWREYDLPVYPIAVVSYRHVSPFELLPLRVRFPNKRVLEFDFDAIDLARMDAASHVKMPNPAALALAARMRFRRERRRELIKDFAVTLAQMMLSKSVGDRVASFFFSYQRYSAKEALHLREEIGKVESTEMRERIMQLTNPWIEAGKQEGRQEGIVQGEAELVLRLLARRLGTVSTAQEKAIRKLALPKIEALGEALLEFESNADLRNWLRLNK
jgi:predicted transposase/invertase (TIGR01784 family)